MISMRNPSGGFVLAGVPEMAQQVEARIGVEQRSAGVVQSCGFVGTGIVGLGIAAQAQIRVGGCNPGEICTFDLCGIEIEGGREAQCPEWVIFGHVGTRYGRLGRGSCLTRLAPTRRMESA